MNRLRRVAAFATPHAHTLARDFRMAIAGLRALMARARGNVATVALIGMICAGALTVAGLMAHMSNSAHLVAQGTSGIDVAKRVATNLTSIGSDNADIKLKALIDDSTGAFKEQISVYGPALGAVLGQRALGASSQVASAGIERNDPGAVTALVVIDAVQVNGKAEAKHTKYYLDIELKAIDGIWAAAGVTFVE